MQSKILKLYKIDILIFNYIGLEWHGLISRQECDQIIGNEEGNFLVRASNNPPSSSTLAIR